MNKNSKALVFIVVFVLIVSVIAIFRTQMQLNDLKKQHSELAEKHRQAKIELERVEEELENLGTREHMDKLAHEQGFRNPDTIVYENNLSDY